MDALEIDIEAEVIRVAQNYGWLSRKLQWAGRRGAPDRIFFGHGRCVLIEFKRFGKTPFRGLQAKEVPRLKERYPEVYFCESVTHAFEILGIEQ